MKAAATIAATLAMFVLILSEINYRQAHNAIMHTERTDSDITGILELYGFNPEGDPFYQPSRLEKVIAVFNP